MDSNLLILFAAAVNQQQESNLSKWMSIIKARNEKSSKRLLIQHYLRKVKFIFKKPQNILMVCFNSQIQNKNIHHAVINKNLAVLRCFFERDEKTFKENFRLEITTFHKLIKFLFTKDKPHGWTIEIEVMIFLFWLASGCCHRTTWMSFHTPKSTLCRIVQKYLKILAANLDKFVHIPKGNNELDQLGQGFCVLANNNCFEKAAGAIDGCHVKLTKVPGEHKLSYFSSDNGCCTSNFQAVVDHEGFFIDVFIGLPGSVHDSTVFRNSPLYLNASYPPNDYYLLGDGDYPLLSAPIGMITPFPQPQVTNPVQSQFNSLHSKATTIVKRSFGRLKARWRSIFVKQLECSYLKAPFVISACIALENFAVSCNDIIEADPATVDNDNVGVSEVVLKANDVSGYQLRERIVALSTHPVNLFGLANDHSYCN